MVQSSSYVDQNLIRESSLKKSLNSQVGSIKPARYKKTNLIIQDFSQHEFKWRDYAALDIVVRDTVCWYCALWLEFTVWHKYHAALKFIVLGC